MIVLAIVFLGLSLFGQDASEQVAQASNTERVSFAPGGILRITTPSSNLFIDAWDQPDVEVTTNKSGRQSCLDSIRTTTEHRSAAELAISTVRQKGKKCGVKLELQVRTPRDTNLVIHHGAGYVYVSRVAGGIEAISRSGDIVLMLPDDPDRYSIDASTKWGTISSDFAGTARSKDLLLGEQFSRTKPSPSRRIFLRVGFGGITIKEVPPTPEAPLAAVGQ